MNTATLVRDERATAYAHISNNLCAAHKLLQEAEAINRAHALGLDLPAARPVLDKLAAVCKRAHQDRTP